MLVNYLKLKNISSRGRVIALSIIGGVFVFLILFSIWQRNFSDTLIGYAPEDTTLYVHFSRPKINDSAKIDQVLSKIFKDLKLPDYESLDINREVAIIGRLENNQNQYAVIIKTDRPSKVKKILIESKLKSKKLSYGTFLLADDDLISNYKKPKKNHLKSTIRKRFHSLSSINVYASEHFFTANPGDSSLAVVYSILKNENSDLVLSFKANGSKLKMMYGGISSAVSAYSKFESKDVNQNLNGDLVFFTSDLYTLLSNWQNNLKIVSDDDYKSFIDGDLGTMFNTYLSSDNRQLSMLAQKNSNNSGWLFGDYDFYVAVENIYPTKIEEILKIIMAYRYPIVKSVYLSDGTRVAELKPDIDQFSFVEKNGINYLYSPDEKSVFMYRSVGSSLVISNSESLINQDITQIGLNYLKFKSDFLANSGFSGYLKAFDVLEISNQGIILK